MSCQLSGRQIAEVIDFHGHQCPGLWIGIRASELCLRELGANDHNGRLVCVVETDMCGVDAVQVLTGCTFGKGNLIHQDFGKTAFSFYRRDDGKSFRALFTHLQQEGAEEREMRGLMALQLEGKAEEKDQQRCQQLRDEKCRALSDADLENLFVLSQPSAGPPRKARILSSLTCRHCGEAAMESRIRFFEGQTLCIPCFEKVE